MFHVGFLVWVGGGCSVKGISGICFAEYVNLSIVLVYWLYIYYDIIQVSKILGSVPLCFSSFTAG